MVQLMLRKEGGQVQSLKLIPLRTKIKLFKKYLVTVLDSYNDHRTSFKIILSNSSGLNLELDDSDDKDLNFYTPHDGDIIMLK